MFIYLLGENLSVVDINTSDILLVGSRSCQEKGRNDEGHKKKEQYEYVQLIILLL